jgi:hypothetical protein
MLFQTSALLLAIICAVEAQLVSLGPICQICTGGIKINCLRLMRFRLTFVLFPLLKTPTQLQIQKDAKLAAQKLHRSSTNVSQTCNLKLPMPKPSNVVLSIVINFYIGYTILLQGRGYADGSADVSPIVALTAARFEQQMLKAEATKRWHSAKVPASKPNPTPSPKRIGPATSTSRALLQDPVQRSLFKPYAACKVKKNNNFVGGNIPNNFIKGMKKWQDCCAACYKRSDCVAWTINKDKKKKNRRGCYLKGIGYTTKKKGSFISGVMTSTDRE